MAEPLIVDGGMLDAELEKLMKFSSLMDELKRLERYKGQYYWRDYPQPARYESVADHSWRLALLVMLLERKLSRRMDLNKALKMALIHDIPEVIAGDESPLGEDGTGKSTHAFNKEAKEARHESEKRAAKRVFDMLPKEEGKELLGLWLEYERQECFEARVVKALDRIEAFLHVLKERNGKMFPKHIEFSTNYSLQLADVDPEIQKFGEQIAREMKDNYEEFKK